jgi:pimeloyl-ACP methyl ester carboxylesterase
MKAFSGRSSTYALALVALPILTALVAEQILEYVEEKPLSTNDTFIEFGGSKIRYLQAGPTGSGANVVFIGGMGNSLEESLPLAHEVSLVASALSYDRGGRGFSHSNASSVGAQADELASLLHSLKWDSPVILVGYSTGGMIARVFAFRFPERTAGLYLIEPYFPELNTVLPGLHGPLRALARWMVPAVLKSFLGILRVEYYLHSWPNQRFERFEVERKSAAIQYRSSHNLAVAREWLYFSQSAEQTLAAKILNAIPVEIAVSSADHDPTRDVLIGLYSAFVDKQKCGSLVYLPPSKHESISQSGPSVAILAARLKSFVWNIEHRDWRN